MHRIIVRTLILGRVASVEGKVVRINRKRQEVILADGSVIAYDHLVLTPGLQVLETTQHSFV